MPVLNRNQQTARKSALGVSVAAILIAQMNASALGHPGAPPGPPLVNHTAPTYNAAPDYADTINGVRVTYLTVGAVQTFLETTMTFFPSTFMLYGEKVSLIQRIWHNLPVRSSKWLFIL